MFFASMDMSSFLRCVLGNCRFGDSRISFHSASVLPSWGLFIRQGDGFSLLKALWALARLQKSLPARFRTANVARRRFFAVLGRQTSHEGVSMPYRCRFQPMARRTTVIQHSWALKRSRKSYWPDIGWKTTLGAVSLPFSADGEKNNDNLTMIKR